GSFGVDTLVAYGSDAGHSVTAGGGLLRGLLGSDVRWETASPAVDNLEVHGGNGANAYKIGGATRRDVAVYGGNGPDALAVAGLRGGGGEGLYFDGSFGVDTLVAYGSDAGHTVVLGNGSLTGLTKAAITWETASPAVDNLEVHGGNGANAY